MLNHATLSTQTSDLNSIGTLIDTQPMGHMKLRQIQYITES